jgi:hypothetical protein
MECRINLGNGGYPSGPDTQSVARCFRRGPVCLAIQQRGHGLKAVLNPMISLAHEHVRGIPRRSSRSAGTDKSIQGARRALQPLGHVFEAQFQAGRDTAHSAVIAKGCVMPDGIDFVPAPFQHGAQTGGLDQAVL